MWLPCPQKAYLNLCQLFDKHVQVGLRVCLELGLKAQDIGSSYTLGPQPGLNTPSPVLISALNLFWSTLLLQWGCQRFLMHAHNHQPIVLAAPAGMPLQWLLCHQLGFAWTECELHQHKSQVVLGSKWKVFPESSSPATHTKFRLLPHQMQNSSEYYFAGNGQSKYFISTGLPNCTTGKLWGKKDMIMWYCSNFTRTQQFSPIRVRKKSQHHLLYLCYYVIYFPTVSVLPVR